MHSLFFFCSDQKFRAEKLLAADGGTIAPPERPRQGSPSTSAMGTSSLITSTRARRTDDSPVVHERKDASDKVNEDVRVKSDEMEDKKNEEEEEEEKDEEEKDEDEDEKAEEEKDEDEKTDEKDKEIKGNISGFTTAPGIPTTSNTPLTDNGIWN